MRNDIWKRQAEDDLREYEAKKKSLENIPDSIRELEEKMTSIRSQTADSVSVKGGGGNRDDAYLSNIVARDHLSAKLENNRRFVSRVSNALSILTDEEKKILTRFYIVPERGVAYSMAEEKGVDHKTVYKWKDAALERFVTAMYG